MRIIAGWTIGRSKRPRAGGPNGRGDAPPARATPYEGRPTDAAGAAARGRRHVRGGMEDASGAARRKTGRPAHDERRGQDHRLRRSVVAGDPAEEALGRRDPQVVNRLRDHGERGAHELGPREIVEGDERHIRGHPEAGLVDRVDRSERHRLVRRQDGGRAIRQPKGDGRCPAGVRALVAGPTDQVVGHREASLPKRRRPAGLADRARHPTVGPEPCPRDARRIESSPLLEDDRDPPVPQSDEVAHRVPGSAVVVDDDDVAADARGSPVEEHHGNAALLRLQEVAGFARRRGNDDQAVHLLVDEDPHGGALKGELLVRVREDDLEVLHPGSVGNAPDRLREERELDVRDHDPQRPGGARLHAPGKRVRPVAEARRRPRARAPGPPGSRCRRHPGPRAAVARDTPAASATSSSVACSATGVFACLAG